MPWMEAEIARIIQLAVTPVFLIMGIGGILGVLLGRLKLMFQRYRRVDAELRQDPDTALSEEQKLEFQWLDRRMQLMHRAITLSTLSMLLVCLVIITLFVEEFIRIDLSGFVAGLFVAAMVALVFALSFFLMEIRIATRMLRVRQDLLSSK
ncbi:MAG: DUF2721 domain-containing protein [Pseudomonadota bacterium]